MTRAAYIAENKKNILIRDLFHVSSCFEDLLLYSVLDFSKLNILGKRRLDKW